MENIIQQKEFLAPVPGLKWSTEGVTQEGLPQRLSTGMRIRAPIAGFKILKGSTKVERKKRIKTPEKERGYISEQE